VALDEVVPRLLDYIIVNTNNTRATRDAIRTIKSAINKLSLFFIKCKFPPNSEWLSATHNSLVKLRQSTGMMSPAKFPRTFAPKVFRSARLMLLHDSLRARGNGSHFPGDYKASRREGDEPASERRRKIEHLTVNSVQSLIAAIVQLRNVNFGGQSASCTAACAKAKPFGDCKNALTRIQDGRL
jgi:hypothetical protein